MSTPRFDPQAQRNAGVDPDGTLYPLVAPSADARGLLADLQLVLSAPRSRGALPYRIAWLRGFTAPFYEDEGSSLESSLVDSSTAGHAADVRIVDADDQVVFDTTEALDYRGRRLGARFYSHYWRADGATLRVIQHAAFAAEEIVWADPLEPEAARIDERCLTFLPERLERWWADGQAAQLVQLHPGHNAVWRIVARDVDFRGRPVTRLALSLEPGGGLGRYPLTSPTGPAGLRTINGASPDAQGRLNVSGDGCLWARPALDLALEEDVVVAQPVAGHLVLGNDCAACQQCSDVAAVQQAVLGAWELYQAARDRLEAARQAYVDLVAAWEAQRQCRIDQAVALDALPAGRRVDVAAAVCNHTDDCFFEVDIDVTVTLSDPEFTVTLDAARVSRTEAPGVARAYTLEPITGGWRCHWHRILPQEDGAVRFPLIVSQTSPSRGVELRLEAVARVQGVPLGDRAVKRLELGP